MYNNMQLSPFLAKWNGGFNAVELYKALQAAISFIEEMVIREIIVSSPRSLKGFQSK